MTRDFADFLAALNSEGVSYVVIGGMAVLALIPYRTTRDIDVLIEPSLENAERTRRAVATWGRFEPEYTAADFISGDILSFGGLLRAEIHSKVPGADWENVAARSEPGEFQGVPTRFACLEDLIAMKAAAGRPEKDLPDLRRLRKLLERREQG
jgi:predicted nucleotidyltransferase